MIDRFSGRNPGWNYIRNIRRSSCKNSQKSLEKNSENHYCWEKLAESPNLLDKSWKKSREGVEKNNSDFQKESRGNLERERDSWKKLLEKPHRKYRDRDRHFWKIPRITLKSNLGRNSEKTLLHKLLQMYYVEVQKYPGKNSFSYPWELLQQPRDVLWSNTKNWQNFWKTIESPEMTDQH